MNKNFVLNTREGNLLNISIYSSLDLKKKGTIIFVHGFKGFKEWGFGPYLANYFAAHQFDVLTFNFSHNGIGDIPTEFSEFDKFANNTFSLEISELEQLISAYFEKQIVQEVNENLFLIGHSRGGAISLLTATHSNNISGLAVWATISKLDRYTERQKIEWRKKGYFEVINARTKQTFKLNVSLLEDIEKNSDTTLNIERSVRNLNKPLLIVHGTQDLAVPINEAEQIYMWSNKNLTSFHTVGNTGHTFDVVHPFIGSNEKFDDVLSTTKNFFEKLI
ncbi:MAG: alpha/beta hydrolase [Ignavibacteriaceae bacterium]|nr:alpha/beta hydrolase [Ignavibacteriaceae bacterium]